MLPPDSSQKMMTFLAPGAKPVEIDFYVNQKRNALSSLTTGEAATDVSTQINTSFTRTLDEVGLALVSSLATPLDDSEAKKAVYRLGTGAGGISVQLISAAGTAEMVAAVLSSGDSLLTSGGSLASSSSQAGGDATGAIRQGAVAVTSTKDALGGFVHCALSLGGCTSARGAHPHRDRRGRTPAARRPAHAVTGVLRALRDLRRARPAAEHDPLRRRHRLHARPGDR